MATDYTAEAELYNRADIAGRNAATACVPAPMRVLQHASAFDASSDIVQEWDVPEGACGFAWINIKPANSRFCKYLKNAGIGRTDSYYGGRTVWVSAYGQSHARKVAYAHAFARVLRENGIARAYAGDRLD